MKLLKINLLRTTVFLCVDLNGGIRQTCINKTNARSKQLDCDCKLFCLCHVRNALKNFLRHQFQSLVLQLSVQCVSRSLCFQTEGYSSTLSCRRCAFSPVFSSFNLLDDELNKKIPVFPRGGCFSVLQNCNKSKKKSSPTVLAKTLP